VLRYNAYRAVLRQHGVFLFDELDAAPRDTEVSIPDSRGEFSLAMPFLAFSRIDIDRVIIWLHPLEYTRFHRHNFPPLLARIARSGGAYSALSDSERVKHGRVWMNGRSSRYRHRGSGSGSRPGSTWSSSSPRGKFAETRKR
jgi:hypothetical protein